MSSTAAAVKRAAGSKAPSLSARSLNANLKAGEQGELQEQRFLITPIIAKHILDKHNHANRSLNETHLSSLVRDIKRGHWIGSTGTMVSFAQNGQLIDGQHRLAAIVKSRTPLPLSLKFGLDVAAQRVIDTGRKRTYSDFIAMTEGLDAKYKTERAAVTRLVYGFLHDQTNPHLYANNNKPTQSDLYDVAAEFNHDISEAVSTTLGPGLVQKVVIGSFAAFVAVLAKHSDYSEHVKDFFHLLGTGANLEADDPIMVVRNRLMMRSEFRDQKDKDRTIGLLIKAWNMWIEGKPASPKMHTPDALVPMVGLARMGKHKLYR